jgi:hypothetical protein
MGVLQGATDPSKYALHCPHSSESSTADTCTDSAAPNVPNYCAYATAFCADGDTNLFPDKPPGDEAMVYCANTVTDLVGAGPGPFYRAEAFETFADSTGNSLGCLNYWITMAPMDPETYCPMADWNPDNWRAAGGEGVCEM